MKLTEKGAGGFRIGLKRKYFKITKKKTLTCKSRHASICVPGRICRPFTRKDQYLHELGEARIDPKTNSVLDLFLVISEEGWTIALTLLVMLSQRVISAFAAHTSLISWKDPPASEQC